MFALYPNERLVMTLHRHWSVLAGKIIIVLFLIIVPLVASFFFTLVPDAWRLLVLFLTSIYLLIVFLFTMVFWMDYYLDMWIVTDMRVIDIEQRGIFRRHIAEFKLDRIQDVTIEIPNMIASLLNYGDLRVQTAGEREFVIRDVPHLNEVKDALLHQIVNS